MSWGCGREFVACGIVPAGRFGFVTYPVKGQGGPAQVVRSPNPARCAALPQWQPADRLRHFL